MSIRWVRVSYQRYKIPRSQSHWHGQTVLTSLKLAARHQKVNSLVVGGIKKGVLVGGRGIWSWLVKNGLKLQRVFYNKPLMMKNFRAEAETLLAHGWVVRQSRMGLFQVPPIRIVFWPFIFRLLWKCMLPDSHVQISQTSEKEMCSLSY